VFALLPDNSRLFQQIKCFIPLANPKTVLTDFESAAMSANSLAFPSASIRCCFFHFVQCVYRQIQASGLQAQYEGDAEFAPQMRYLSALAFVPTANVVTAFEDLTQRCPYSDKAQPVVYYF
jgi:MULE transposase domain